MTTIVVTGIGTTNPLGGDAASTWSALLAGESGISTLEHDWVARHELPVTFAGQAKVAAVDVLERQEVKRLDPSAQFALISAREAWADAGSPDVDPERILVDYATGIGGLWTLLDGWDTLREKGPRRVLPMTIPMLMPNAAAAAVSMGLGAKGGARTVVSACASGTESIANAYEHLQLGLADVVVAGEQKRSSTLFPLQRSPQCKRCPSAMMTPRKHPGPMTPTVMVLCWARVLRRWCWKRRNTRLRVVHGFMRS